MIGQDTSLADDIQKDANNARNAVRMGKQAAQTAKTLSKAATHAATGDVVGAAATVLSDPKTVKTIIIIVAVPILVISLLICMVLYSLPTALFEGLSSFSEKIDEAVYSGEFPNAVDAYIVGTIRAISDAVGDLVRSIWDGLKSLFSDTETEELPDYESSVISQEAAEKLAIIKKAIVTNDKYDIRAEQIVDAVNNSSLKSEVKSYLKDVYKEMYSDTWTSSSSVKINSLNIDVKPLGTTSPEHNATEYLSELEDYIDDIEDAGTLSELADLNEEFNAKVNELFPMVDENDADNTNALYFLSALTVQQGGSLQNMELSDYMKYLGWYTNSDPKDTYITIEYADGYSVDVPVTTWKGTFMPQYLYEEINTYKDRLTYIDAVLSVTDNDDLEEERDELESKLEEYEDYGAPLMDFMIAFNFPNVDMSNCDVASEPSVKETDSTDSTYYNVKTLYTYTPYDNSDCYWTATVSERYHEIYEWIPDEPDTEDEAEPEPEPEPEPEAETEETGHWEYQYTQFVKVTVSIDIYATVTPRSAYELASILGFRGVSE